jgi:hypothetical protein
MPAYGFECRGHARARIKSYRSRLENFCSDGHGPVSGVVPEVPPQLQSPRQSDKGRYVSWVSTLVPRLLKSTRRSAF